MNFKENKSYHHLLWKISKPGFEPESFLYGTIHLRDRRVYFMVDKLKEIIETSEIFIAEYNLDDDNEIQIMDAVQFENGKSLHDFIPQKKFGKSRKAIKRAFNIDIENLKFLKPIAIENMITESIFNNDYRFPMDIE